MYKVHLILLKILPVAVGRLDRNKTAINNDIGHFGPPKYKDAKFTLSREKKTITINIVYL